MILHQSAFSQHLWRLSDCLHFTLSVKLVTLSALLIFKSTVSFPIIYHCEVTKKRHVEMLSPPLTTLH